MEQHELAAFKQQRGDPVLHLRRRLEEVSRDIPVEPIDRKPPKPAYRGAMPRPVRDHSDELHNKIGSVLLRQDSAHWLQLFQDNAINVSRLAQLEDMLTDEQAIATGVLAPPVEDVGVPYVINPPLFVDGAEQVGPRRAPEIGEHTDEVLASLGYDAETIAGWRESGKI